VRLIYQKPGISLIDCVFHLPLAGLVSPGKVQSRYGGHVGELKATTILKYPGCDLDTDGWIDVGNIAAGIKSIAMWVKPDAIDVTDYPIDLDEGIFLRIVNGILQVPGGFPGTNIRYVDGVVGATVTANWHLISWTTTVDFAFANDLDIGRVEGSGYFNGIIDNIMLFTRILSAEESKSIFERMKYKYGIG